MSCKYIRVHMLVLMAPLCVCANAIKMILTQIGVVIIPTILVVTRIQLKCNLVSHVIYTLARGTGVACIAHRANMI